MINDETPGVKDMDDSCCEDCGWFKPGDYDTGCCHALPPTHISGWEPYADSWGVFYSKR